MDGARGFDRELDAQLVATALEWIGPLLGVIALLTAAALTAEILEQAGRAARTSALLAAVTPAVFRRLAALSLVAVPIVQPASDGETPVRDWLTETTTTTTTPDTATTSPGIATPVGPPVFVGPDPAEPPVLPMAPPPIAVAEPDHYIVEPGDCLWTIAERRLPTGATNLAIDSAWRQVYAANAQAIGANPNLIMVGLALELPPLDIP